MSRHWPVARWVLLGAAAILLVVFVLAQQQSVNVSYGDSPSRGTTVEGSAGELTEVTLPSTAELSAMLADEPVVRLPGAIAHWDQARVEAAAGDTEVRIIAAPPGLDKEQRAAVKDVENATVVVIGTEVTGDMYQVTSDDLDAWRAEYATGDVTSQIVTLLHALRDSEPPGDEDSLTWRAPTEAELAPVVADLRAGRPHVAEGATLAGRPDNAEEGTLIAAFPQQAFGEPVPDYGTALAGSFPDTPLYVMYGNWVEYRGPHAEEFTEVAGGTFYGQFGNRLSRLAYPQQNVLRAYLDRALDVRYSGLFDRPLPYLPPDPLRVALPALPWLFGLCVLGFVALSIRPVLGTDATEPRRPPARLAGLTTLAIEMSALSHHPSLTRAISQLEAARGALAENLPDRHIQKLLDAAQRELDVVARKLGRADYRPRVYLAGGIS